MPTVILINAEDCVEIFHHTLIHTLIKKRVISVYYGLTLIVVILGGGDATEEVRESSLLTNPVYGVK